MTLHRRVELAPFRADRQIQLAVERKNLEVITMRPRGRTRSAVTRFAEVIRTVNAFWSTSFLDAAGLRRDIPNSPMREQPVRGIRIIDDQGKAFRSRRNIRDLQGRAGIRAVTCKF